MDSSYFELLRSHHNFYPKSLELLKLMACMALVHEHRACLIRRRTMPFFLRRINVPTYVVVHDRVGFVHNAIVSVGRFDAFGSDVSHRFVPSCAESKIVLSLHV